MRKKQTNSASPSLQAISSHFQKALHDKSFSRQGRRAGAGCRVKQRTPRCNITRGGSCCQCVSSACVVQRQRESRERNQQEHAPEGPFGSGERDGPFVDVRECGRGGVRRTIQLADRDAQLHSHQIVVQDLDAVCVRIANQWHVHLRKHATQQTDWK